MAEATRQRGVLDDAIVLDAARRRTCDTCYWARDIFASIRQFWPRSAFTCPARSICATPRVGQCRRLGPPPCIDAT